jgi:hypothetical protein
LMAGLAIQRPTGVTRLHKQAQCKRQTEDQLQSYALHVKDTCSKTLTGIP